MPADAWRDLEETAARIRALAYRNHPEPGRSGDHAWDSGKAGVAARDLRLIRLRREIAGAADRIGVLAAGLFDCARKMELE